jgi:hypothetical protein
VFALYVHPLQKKARKKMKEETEKAAIGYNGINTRAEASPAPTVAVADAIGATLAVARSYITPPPRGFSPMLPSLPSASADGKKTSKPTNSITGNN